MRTHTTRLYQWALLKAASSKAPFWVALLFSLEIFLFIPLDLVLMFFCLQNPRKTFLYILIAAFASTLSATVGYMLGHFLWDLIGSYLVPSLISTSLFDRISSHFQLYESWAVFLGAFLPLPLKALSLVAGVFHVGFLPFFCFLLIARLLRFSIVGMAMLIWGERLKNFVDRYFHGIVLVVGAKVVAAFLFFWAIAH